MVYPVFRSTLKTAMFPHFLSWSAWTIRKPFSAVLVLQYAFAVFASEKPCIARAFSRLTFHVTACFRA